MRRGGFTLLCSLAWWGCSGSGGAGAGTEDSGTSAGATDGTDSASGSASGSVGSSSGTDGSSASTSDSDSGGEVDDDPPPSGECNELGWCWAYPLPHAQNMAAVWVASPTDAWSVGDQGAMRHYDGAAWTRVEVTERNLLDVWGAASDDVWVVGEAGTVLHYDGAAWSPVELPADLGGLYAVHGIATDDVWAVGHVSGAGRVAHWNGTAWTVVPDLGFDEDVWVAGPDDVWLADDGGTVGHFDGLDTTAESLGSSSAVTALWGFASDDVWAATVDGAMHYDGVQWSLDPGSIDDASPPTRVFDVWGPEPGNVFAVGSTVRHVVDGTWNDAGLNYRMAAVAGSSATDVWVVGSRGRRAHFDGVSWFEESPEFGPESNSFDFKAIWGAGQGDIWVGGTGLFRLKDEELVPQESGVGNVFDLWGSGPGDVWVVGVGTYTGIAHFDGQAWVEHELPEGVVRDVRAIWGSSPEDVWAVTDADDVEGPGDPHAAHVIHWDGDAWSVSHEFPSEGPFGIRLSCITGSGPDDVWAGGQLDTLLHFDGSTWTSIDPMGTNGNETVRAVWSAGPGEVWLGTHEGLFRGGTQGFARDPEIDGPVVRIEGESSTDVWALTMQNAYSEQWAQGDAAIWHFDGDSWTREQTSAGQTVGDILVLPERVFVATGSGGVLHRER